MNLIVAIISALISMKMTRLAECQNEFESDKRRMVR